MSDAKQDVTLARFVGATAGTTRKARASSDANGTSVTVTRDSESHETTGIDGSTVTYSANSETDTHTAGQWPAEADQHVRELIEDATAAREKRENTRANHRNLNRMLTLFGALFIGLAVTFLLQHHGIPGLVNLPAWSYGLAPYTFVITIALDSGLAVYGLIRHY